MAKRLEYEIGVDSSKGVSGLKQFSAAAKKELKGVSDAIDDTSSNAEKISKVFSEQAAKIEKEMKEAADAAEALGKALGPEIASRADLDSITADLNKMGLEFNEITADADKLAVGLRELDRVGQSGIGGSLPSAARRAKGGVDELRGSADQSRSVLANMVGNSAQDLGALGGVAGSTGVLIGQLGEYAADGNIKLGALAKLGAPMIGLAAGIALVNQHLASIARTEAFNKKRVVDFTAAMEDATVTAQELQDVLASEEDPNSIIANIGSDMTDVEDAVASTLGTFDAFRRIVRGGEDALNDWITDQLAMASAAGATEDELKDLNDALLLGLTTNKVNAAVGRAVAAGYKDQVDTAYALGQAIRQQGDASDEAARDNQFYGDSIRDAKEASEEAAATIPGVGRVYDEFSDKALDAAQAQIEFAEATRDAATELVDAQNSLNEMATSFHEMERREDALSAAFDLGDAPLDALEKTQDVFVATHDLIDLMNEKRIHIEGSPIDAINDWVAQGGDPNTAPLLAKIDSLRETVQTRVSDAFETGGAPAGRAMALSLIEQIRNSFGGYFTSQQIAELIGLDDFEAIIKVALEQESLDEARAELALLAGLPGADPLYVAQIQLALDAGTLSPQAASVLLAEKLGDFGLDVPTELLPADPGDLATARAEADAFIAANPLIFGSSVATPDPTEAHRQAEIIAEALKIAFPSLVENPTNTGTVLRDEQRTLNQHPLVIPVQYKITDRNPLRLDSGGTAPSGGGVAGERGPEIINGKYLTTGPTYVPPGTKVTSRRQTAVILRNGGTHGLKRYDQGGIVPAGPVTVNVNAGVVGNRYDVMRAVQRANLDKVRLLGTRG